MAGHYLTVSALQVVCLGLTAQAMHHLRTGLHSGHERVNDVEHHGPLLEAINGPRSISPTFCNVLQGFVHYRLVHQLFVMLITSRFRLLVSSSNNPRVVTQGL